MNILEFTSFSNDVQSSHESNSSRPLKPGVSFFLCVNVLPPTPLPVILAEFSFQPSNLNWIATALVTFHCITDCHRAQCCRITINLYHLPVPVGQELKTNMWKAWGSDFIAAAQGGGQQEVGGSRWLIAILKSRATQATPSENSRPGAALLALGSVFWAMKVAHIWSYSVFPASFLPGGVHRCREHFPLYCLCPFQSNSILFKRKKEREK